jgi:hypothetical protein
MAVKLTPDQYVAKHAQRTKAAVPDYTAGVQNVSSSPTAAAAAKQQKMVTNLTDAVNSGKWKNGLLRVSLDDWKKATTEKGAGRIAAGVDGAAGKVLGFAQQLLPFESTLQETVNKMPDLTLEDSVNRATSWIRGMSKFQRK